MDHYQIISGSFQATIESIAMSVDALAQPLSQASELISTALVQDRKILCCGEGADAALASLFTSNLLGYFERERPALPVCCLTDSASLTAISAHSGTDDIFSRQIRALGQAGDVLLCIDSAPTDSPRLQRARQAAVEAGLGVVSLTRSADISTSDGIIAIAVTTAQRHRAVELHTMIIHCLCDLIDQNIFGPNQQET